MLRRRSLTWCIQVKILYVLYLNDRMMSSAYIFSEGYGRLNIWDERVRKCSTQSKLHAHRINSIDFNSQNYNIMATSSSDGIAAIWDLRSFKVDQPRPLEEVGHDKVVQSAYFSPSRSSLITTRYIVLYNTFDFQIKYLMIC